MGFKATYQSWKQKLQPRAVAVHRKIPRRLRKPLYGSVMAFLLFLLLDVLFPFRVEVEYSTIVTANDNTVMHAFLTTDDKWRMMTELEEITPELKKAIVYKEDKYFYYHFGINPVAIVRAMYNNIVEGKRTSGASTITMQVVRLLAPKERTYWNKLTEMFRAMQLEWHYTKDEILQLYLNLVPYGGNIEGVKSAAILYFDKSPNHLSIAEITALAIIPNRPTSLRLGHSNEFIQQERNRWLERFRADGLFTDESIDDAIEEPLSAYRREAPKLAPHFSYRMKRLYAHLPIIKTQLDLQKQRKVEQLTMNHVNQLYTQNIKNAAVLVVNNHTGAVEAYVGSADFNNRDDGGQVDGIRAVRSPGSTLKPLLYGLAFDKGVVTPKTIISDVPVNYSGYKPENYDGKFYGNITVEHALANSLNVPAVKVLSELKTEQLTLALKQAHFNQIGKDEDKLGLSLVLGGCGVTLEELTHLYHAFAHGGNYMHFNWLKGDSAIYQERLLSEASNFMITEILTQVTRPDLPLEWHNSAHLPKVAWKTGTSYGRKDAWSIGYNKNYTIGVWVGNFSAEGVPGLNGSETASPLLFNVFNEVDRNSQREWFMAPEEEIEFRLVCTESGKVPDDFCTSKEMDYFIPTVSSNEKCTHLREVWISPDSTISYCTTCQPDAGYIAAEYQNYSPEILTYFEQYQIKYDKIPTHNPDCERVFANGVPEITSPVEGVDYFVDEVDSTEIMLTCNVANDVEKVYWYVNNKFYKMAGANEKVFYYPPEGKLKISCTDDKGRNANTWITVEYITF